jgi:phenylalanyl-tRNA synthetase beta chain
MNVSTNWLKELVPSLSDDAESIAHRFSMTAAAVEGVQRVGEGLEHIVVARVLKTEKHPNADRLSLCVVDTGNGEPVDVVCGAPVIVEGALYPYVPVGATLPAGFMIEERKIRGEVSRGMLCSEIELELGRDKGGIMRLPDDLEPGTPLTDVLQLPDVRLGLDLNPNRVDLACHVGVAREFVASAEAIVERDFGTTWSPTWSDGDAEAAAGGLCVTIEAPERCSRYLAAIVRGVKIGPSPAWLVGRLLAVGARPINNVVDATNYVLLERNQPLHAFDLSTLSGSEVRVRAATAGETLETLDGETRKLTGADTVIADRDRAVALAGVMGGADTEVTPHTVDVLVECAAFDPLSVRKTARSAGLSTEASYRFERGIDVHAQEAAIRRCVELILAIAGGTADPNGIRVGPEPAAPPAQPLRTSRVKQVLGLELDDDGIAALLEPIGFQRTGESGLDGAVMYAVPGWRGDVTREIDLVEEVARRFGFENFPNADRRFRSSSVPEHPGFERADRVRRFLTGRGMFEARSLSFMPEDHRGNRATVAVPNPLSAEESYLRGSMVPVLLRRAEHNFARGRRDVRLFEVGTVFDLRDASEAVSDAGDRNAGLARYAESSRLGIVLTGARRPAHWEAASADFDVWDLKALAEEIATGLCEASLESCGAGEDAVADSFGGAWVGPERFRVVRNGATVGLAGAVRSAAIDAPPWAAPVWALELDLEAVSKRGVAAYRPMSTYPVVRRDLAITVPVAVSAGEVQAAVTETASELLESARLFDVYEGEGVGEGRRSLGWAFRFRADDRTLTDEDVEAEMNALSAALEKRFDARIRSS